MRPVSGTYPVHFLVKIVVLSAAIMLPMALLLCVKWPVHIDHVLRSLMLAQVSDAFWQGDIYPRWLMHVNDGLGSPVMLLQPQVFYYLAVLMEPFSRLDPHGWGRMCALLFIILFLGGMACYRWLREYYDDESAQKGVLLYISFPAIISNPLYISNALPTICAMMLFPLILFYAKKMAEDHLHYVVHFSLSIALLATCHLPSTAIFIIVPLTYALISADKTSRLAVFFTALGSLVLAALISAFYWMPLFENKKYILYQLYLQSPDPYSLFPRILWDGHLNFYQIYTLFFRMLILLLALLPLYFIAHITLKNIYHKKPVYVKREKIGLYLLHLGLLVFAAFMVSPFARILWEQFPIFKPFQFPVRFFYIAIPSTIFLMTRYLPEMKNFSGFHCTSLMMLALAFLTSANYLYIRAPDHYWRNVYERKFVPQEAHMTVWMQKAYITNAMNPPLWTRDMIPFTLARGQAELTNIVQEPRAIHFRAKVTSPSAIVMLKRYYYPGWVVAEGAPAGMSIGELSALLAVTLPQGEYEVTIKQPWFPGEKAGSIMSAAGILLLLAWGIIARKRRAPVKKNSRYQMNGSG